MSDAATDVTTGKDDIGLFKALRDLGAAQNHSAPYASARRVDLDVLAVITPEMPSSVCQNVKIDAKGGS